jgi:hypothetical protein
LRANLPKEIAMSHRFDLRIGALCAFCAPLLFAPSAFANPLIEEITGRYSTVTPGGPTMMTLSGGMVDQFTGGTNDQLFIGGLPLDIQGMDIKQPGQTVFDLGGAMYDEGNTTRTFDILNPGKRIDDTEVQVPLSLRMDKGGTDFQTYNLSDVADAILIFDLTGAHIGEDGQFTYDNTELSATFRIVSAASVPEPTSLALVIPGLISLLGLRYLGRRRSQAG